MVKKLKPVKGLIICSNEKLQKIAKTVITPKKIHRIMVAVLSEISILYFTFFCFLILKILTLKTKLKNKNSVRIF